MNKQFAEFVGIFIGDGSLNIRKEKNSYEFKIVGNIQNEKGYFEKYVSKIASKITGREIKPKILDSGRSYGIYFCSKKLANKLSELGFKSGKKADSAVIPNEIIRSKNLLKSCLRGIFDTDGCFTAKRHGTYPTIAFVSKSKKLIQQIEKILIDNEIKCCACYDIKEFDKRYFKEYTKSRLDINGRKSTQMWFKIFGTKNNKHLIKYLKYKANRGLRFGPL